MEIYFVDIGQGTSNLILLGQNRAIVIDCGSKSGVLLQLMRKLQVEEIVRLVVSHNHDDHIGGAMDVLTSYRGRIEKICFLQDGLLYQTDFWARIQQQRRDNVIDIQQLVRLECDDTPRALYQENTPKRSLKILSPRFGDNLQAVQENDQNATSGVLMLAVENSRIVFAGDSTARQWRRIRQLRTKHIDCDILAVAHHGGRARTTAEDLQWLYKDGIKPRCAVVSLATSNTHGHPREDVIRALTSSGATVVCTQITKKCCDDLETLRPGVLTPTLPGFSKQTTDLTGSNNSRNVACGGTMVAEWSNSQLAIRRLPEHQSAVNRLVGTAGCHPLCR
jgi:competence protein ComEC